MVAVSNYPNEECRLHDLIAKSSRVSLKNTVKVLRTLQAVSAHKKMTIDDLVANEELLLTKASDAEQVACEVEYLRFEQFLRQNGFEQLLDEIQNLEFDQ
jgi:mannitol-specific phosphotransferase system IIBC component